MTSSATSWSRSMRLVSIASCSATDWPVATQAIAVGRWVRLLDEVMADANEIEQRKFWRDNAARFYRLGI